MSASPVSKSAPAAAGMYLVPAGTAAGTVVADAQSLCGAEGSAPSRSYEAWAPRAIAPIVFYASAVFAAARYLRVP